MEGKRKPTRISEVREVTSADEATRLLKEGWRYLAINVSSNPTSYMSADFICGGELGRKEIERRTAVALIDFVEKVSAGKSSRSPRKNETTYYVARPEEITILPEVARILLEISQRLPE